MYFPFLTTLHNSWCKDCVGSSKVISPVKSFAFFFPHRIKEFLLTWCFSELQKRMVKVLIIITVVINSKKGLCVNFIHITWAWCSILKSFLLGDLSLFCHFDWTVLGLHLKTLSEGLGLSNIWLFEILFLIPGACFLRTDQMDGETDWKLRLTVEPCQRLPCDAVSV